MSLIKFSFELIVNICLILLKFIMKIGQKHTYKFSGNAYRKINKEIKYNIQGMHPVVLAYINLLI
jgi:hypothetical protein